MASLRDRLKGFKTSSTLIDHMFAAGVMIDVFLPIMSAVMLLVSREPVYFIGSILVGVAASFPIYSYFRDRPPEGGSVFRLLSNVDLAPPHMPPLVDRHIRTSIFTSLGTWLPYFILYKYHQPYLILVCMPICFAISHSVRVKVYRKAAQIFNDSEQRLAKARDEM